MKKPNNKTTVAVRMSIRLRDAIQGAVRQYNETALIPTTMSNWILEACKQRLERETGETHES